jgi:peptidoglycan biosynthesis protein MviN/MurJ (putative lipid II flippase)
VRPRFSGWILPATALPATLVGHALAYFLAGYSQADGHHGYFPRTLECSVALLAGLCLILVARALSRADQYTVRGSSVSATWIKLALMQTALFAMLERTEGYVPALAGCVAQVLVALCAAVALVYFARLLDHCERDAPRASSYLRRLPRP